ncbi:DNA-binding protein [uncultured Tenacibaculum sp.]|uniref:DNA-binding protein n=1 Tax=uncultured Tenacibaculum sp. TaxID=174713 RepID=UPI0026367B4E|nr:DNA-binding protein [uncultured Tenacibaculum sp.]
MEELQEGDKVDLVIGVRTALGYSVLINEEYEGLLYNNEVFSDIEEGMRTSGYIKKIREDEKIDVSLRPQGFRNVIDEDVDKVLKKIEEKGVLMLTDKSSPESIKFHLQMSKKAFKRAIGSLYKQRKIQIFDDRIEIVKNK